MPRSTTTVASLVLPTRFCRMASISATVVESLRLPAKRLGKTLPVKHQPDHHLLAVGPGVARITALGLGISQAQTLKIGRGQVVKQDAVLEREETLLFGAQSSFDRAALAIEPIHIAIEPVLIELAKFFFEKIAQRTAAYPLAHG